MKFLKFSLSAPLQSWGEDTRWDNRGTASMPTKSGIIGMLGCCLGYPRGDDRLSKLNQSLYMAVRADSPGQMMTDFHIIQGTCGILMAANGKERENGSTIISHRQYLQDAFFTVFLWDSDRESVASVLERCYNAMCHPHWPVFLGRKSCTPSRPVKPEWIYAETPDDAVSVFSEDEKKYCSKRKIGYVTVEMDIMPGEALPFGHRVIIRHDDVRRADLNEYGPRRVCAYTIRLGGGGNVPE